MTSQELQHLFALRGIKTKVRGNEVQVGECLFCLNPKFNLEINPVAGFFHAWCCGAKGRADRFIREHLGKDVTITPPPTRLWTSPKVLDTAGATEFLQPLVSSWALKYLEKRGLDTIDHLIYEILEGKGDHWQGRVVFPLREYWGNELVGYIGRAAYPTVVPKYYAHWVTLKRITGYRSNSKIHVVVEGVFDGLRVHQCGYNAAVLGGVHEREIELFAARVPSEHTVVVLLDADAQEQAQKLRWRIYPIHEKTVVAPLTSGLDPAVLDRSDIHRLISEAVKC